MRRISIFLQMLTLLSCANPESSEVDYEVRDVTRSEFQSLCGSQPCRGPVHISLLMEDGSLFERRFTEWPPIVQGGNMVNVLPGDSLVVTGEPTPDGLVNLKVLDDNGPEPWVRFRFEQDDPKGKVSNMRLRIDNTFSRALKLDLHMMLPRPETVHYTSSCPILSGMSSLELWPEPIFQLFVSNFRFVESDGSVNCE